jgi:hypothetical protein
MNKMLIDRMPFKEMKRVIDRNEDRKQKERQPQRENVLTSMAAVGSHKRWGVAVSH